jgi:putative methylase
MITIKKKKHLEMVLQKIPYHPKPKSYLEQYTTPSIIASDVLWNAYTLGDIDSCNIMDLGCGTGIFAIGSSLLGANNVLGLDIDIDSIKSAQNISKDIGVINVNFDVCDVNDVNNFHQVLINNNFLHNDKVDTLFQNPPFGSQEKGNKYADRKFIEMAMKYSEVIYSFHMLSTENFVSEYFQKLGGKITNKFKYHFPLPKIYDFHKKDSYNVDVIVLRVENF